jgi:hypothetical protein
LGGGGLAHRYSLKVLRFATALGPAKGGQKPVSGSEIAVLERPK